MLRAVTVSINDSLIGQLEILYTAGMLVYMHIVWASYASANCKVAI